MFWCVGARLAWAIASKGFAIRLILTFHFLFLFGLSSYHYIRYQKVKYQLCITMGKSLKSSLLLLLLSILI